MSAPPPDPTTTRTDSFLGDLAAALHKNGMPAYRLEDSLLRVAKVLGVELQVFSVPTGITLGFGPLESQRVRMLRVEPGAVNLARVAKLSELIEDIAAGQADLLEAEARLASLSLDPMPHGAAATAFGFAAASGSAAVLLSCGPKETIASTLVGLLLGAFFLAARGSERVARLFELGSAAIAAFVAGMLASEQLGLSRERISLASIIVLLPGYTFTVSLNELAAKHLSAGTSRLGGAFTTFLLLICGTAIGFTAADAIAPHAESTERSFPDYAPWLALLVAPLAFKVLFQARHRDTGWIVVASFLAYLGARLGANALGPAFGAGLGACALAVFSNLLARVRRIPAAITLVPGLLVLVPGSLGYRGFASLISEDAVMGVALVAQMLGVGVSLVGGILVANVILPSRRSL